MLWTSKFGMKKAQIAFTGLRPNSDKNKDLIFIKKLIEDGNIKVPIGKKYRFEQI